jgi:hypothetical protein
MKHKLGSCFLACVTLISISCAAPMSNTNSSMPKSSSPTSAETRETGRSFLQKGFPETPGYGLYSYILFGATPTGATKERYLRTIDAYLNIPQIATLEEYLPTCKLNITYLPLTDPPHSKPEAEWILNHYDYARARILLQALSGTHRTGPYIVSTYKPLSGVTKLSGQYLYQDLSSAPAPIVTLWIKEFLTQTEQERFWEERTAMHCVLEIRKAIGIAAEGLPEVKKSLSTVINWIK